MARKRRCLILERHKWETGGGEQQVQLPLEAANDFFGPGDQTLRIVVRVYMVRHSNTPTFERNATISKEYANGTRRINGFPELGALRPAFLFFEETAESGVYDFWWQSSDLQVVAAKFKKWEQAKNSQYGRGRLVTIVPAPVPREIQHIADSA